MKYIVSSVVLEGEEEYSYSIWIETDYGAVIDMWSDYIKGDLNTVYESLIREFIIKLSKIIREDSEVWIYVDDDRLYNFYMEKLRDVGRLYDEYGVKQTPYNITFFIEKKDREFLNRAYSLASTSLRIKGRYPPRL